MKRMIMAALMAVAISNGIAAEAAKAVWKKDVSKAKIPATAVTGKAHGVDFKVEKATLENGILKLRQGKDFFADQGFSIFTFLKKGEKLDGKKFAVKADDGFGSPHIHFGYKVEGKSLPKTETFMDKYSMRLEFGKTVKKKIPGKIYLCLPDDAKSFIVGTFEAEVKE